MTQSTPFPIIARRSRDVPHPVLGKLEQHWQSLRQDGPIPLRDNVDPSAINTALPWTFILQRVAPGVARMRVAGQKLHEVLGMDPRGMPLSAFFGADDRSTLAVHLEMAFTDPALIALPLYAPSTLLRKQVNGQILLMPLLDAKGDVSRLLGALVTDNHLGSRNNRLLIDNTKPIRHEPIKLMPARIIGAQKKPNASRRPALTLVVNNG